MRDTERERERERESDMQETQFPKIVEVGKSESET